MRKILSVKTILQSLSMGCASISSLIVVFYLTKALNEKDFAQYSYLILIIPIIQSILTYNAISIISVKILKKYSEAKCINYFTNIIIINSILILICAFILKEIYKIENPHVYIYGFLISIVITLCDIHNQLLLAKNKSSISYLFYLLEKVIFLMIILIYKYFIELNFNMLLIIYFGACLFTLYSRFLYYNPWRYNLKNFFSMESNFIPKKYMGFSFLLFLTGYISTNFDRFISSIYLNDATLVLYTKVFYLAAGANMIAQAVIQANLKEIYLGFINKSSVSNYLTKHEYLFGLIGLISFALILLLCLAYQSLFKKDILFTYILLASIPSAILMIANKPYGLYIDFAEKPQLKLYASTISIAVAIFFYYQIQYINWEIFIPALILLVTTITYTYTIKIFCKYLIKNKNSVI